MPERCMMYIDGYNFYYAIKDNPSRTPIHLGWCDFAALASRFMLPPGSILTEIKYFTAPVGRYGQAGGHLGGEAARQERWLQALASIKHLRVIEGVFRGDSPSPRGRGEKETDVNIAVSMVIDAARDRFDRAVLLTGDRDQLPAVKAVTSEFGKRTDVWIFSHQETGFWKFARALEGVQVKPITNKMLEQSRLPDAIKVGDATVEVPKLWRRPG